MASGACSIRSDSITLDSIRGNGPLRRSLRSSSRPATSHSRSPFSRACWVDIDTNPYDYKAGNDLMALDSRIPPGPIEKKWEYAKAHYKLVNPANKRKYDVIV